jgi:UTP:GlnB (protein PII) uridylyltransferase
MRRFISDIIHGVAPVKSMKLHYDERAKIVIATADNRSRSLLIGINARDRPGLLLDISKCLLRLNLQQHRTEAAVFDGRSISVWRCTCVEDKEPDSEQISAMLSVSSGRASFTWLCIFQGLTIFCSL